jgi:RNA polymerase sigma factor (sigma-70 family)
VDLAVTQLALAVPWQVRRGAGGRGRSYGRVPAVRVWSRRADPGAVPAALAEAGVGEEKISARDAEELAACFTAHARELFGYACVLTRGDWALADDLVQAAFEAAGRAWWSLRSLAEDQRRGWLRATLANIAVSGFRRDAAFRDRLPRIEARYRKIAADTPAEAFASIVLQRCWQIIQGMPERQHVVALLRWQQDMKEGEIAAALGIAEKTVSTHLRRTRRKLIAQLGPDYPFTSNDPEGAS